jgi:hypothetical protein
MSMQEGGVAAGACLPAPRVSASVPVFLSSLLVDSTICFVIKIVQFISTDQLWQKHMRSLRFIPSDFMQPRIFLPF